MDRPLLDDLRAEQRCLADLLRTIDIASWGAPTPAVGWTVADTVRHLAVAERTATRSVRDGTDFIGNSADFIGASVEPSVEPRQGPELLATWRQQCRSTLGAFEAAPDEARVPWGGRLMGVRSLATARLMETWAHGLDCFAAVGQDPVDSNRLRHIAWLGWRTLPYAFAIAGQVPPAPLDRLRLELTAPSGELWSFGPDTSEDRLSGDASVWCRVVTHRWRSAEDPPLVAHGPLAVAASRYAQAYLDV